ncbi:hypothetical protein AYI69_g2115 [Smittium culicis]|uniref:Uncharacterized protein n=1 Tax=Smittium culicis TaxID=133412 RepID=A0A1R1YNF1_9FUNG|nr:hypothetical protein AYI69_g2115 [Smittium culicis]
MKDFSVIEWENVSENAYENLDINQIFSENFEVLTEKIPDSDDQYILINGYKDAVSKILQNYIKSDQGNEFCLIMDTQTR